MAVCSENIMQQTVSCRFAYSPSGGDKEKTLLKYLLTSSRWDVCRSKVCMRVEVVLKQITEQTPYPVSTKMSVICYLDRDCKVV